jgi:hypothetical protein
VQRFFANPNTYYLTRGWLEAYDEPLSDYQDYLKEYNQETADYLAEMKYRHYKKLCMVGFSQQELDECRPMAREVADFCAERWQMSYEETIGSTDLLEALLRMATKLDRENSEFVVVSPHGEITADMFHRPGEAPPATTGRRS